MLFSDVVRELRKAYRRAGVPYHEAHAMARAEASRHFERAMDADRTARDRFEQRARDGPA